MYTYDMTTICPFVPATTIQYFGLVFALPACAGLRIGVWGLQVWGLGFEVWSFGTWGLKVRFLFLEAGSRGV